PAPLPEPKPVVVARTEGTGAVNVAAAAVPASSGRTEDKTMEARPSRAEQAAAHFTHDAQPLPSINQPPFAVHGSLAARPAAINAALQQQQQLPQALPQAMAQTPAPAGQSQSSTPAGTTVTVGG